VSATLSYRLRNGKRDKETGGPYDLNVEAAKQRGDIPLKKNESGRGEKIKRSNRGERRSRNRERKLEQKGGVR